MKLKNQKNLFIMCGLPGSGKTTWLHNNIADNGYIISKKDNFKEFIDNIQAALDSTETCDNIYIDAPNITKASRSKLINALNLDNVKNVIVIVLHPNFNETVRRNALRKGHEDYVPKGIIRRMWFQFERPEEDEDRIFDVKYVEV